MLSFSAHNIIQTSALKAKALLIVLWCCLVYQAECQKGPYYITHVNKSNGLSNNSCKAVVKDYLGYIWIATENGLNRYDGHQFEVFNHIPSDPNSITGNAIYELFEDSKHQLWIGGNDFVSRYDLEKNTFFNYDSDLRPEQRMHQTFIESFYEDPQGQLWLCTAGAGFYRYLPEENLFENFLPDPTRQIHSQNKVTDICQDNSGLYWLTTQYGMCSFDLSSKKFEWHRTPSPTEKNGFYNLSISLHMDQRQDHLIWYGTWGTGLHCYNTQTDETSIYLYREGTDMNLSNIVFDIAQKDERTLLLATEMGLWEFDIYTKQFENTKHEPSNPHSLSSNEIKQVNIDDEGIIWLPTYTGVDIIDPHLQYFQLHLQRTGTNIHQFVCDTSNQILYGVNPYTHRQFHIIDLTRWTHESIPLPGADKNISEPFGIFLSRKKEVFVGLVRSNILQYQPATHSFKEIDISRSIGISSKNLDIRSFVEDANDNMWMSNQYGSVIFWDRKKDEFRLFDPQQLGHIGLVGRECTKLILHKNTLWASFNRTGMLQFDVETMTTKAYVFPTTGPVSALQTFTDFSIDANGTFWFGTISHGLIHAAFTGTEFQILQEFYTHVGFPDDNTYSTTKTNDGSLWICSSNGLIRFNPVNNTWQAFDEADGLYPYSSDVKIGDIGHGQLAFMNGDYFTTFSATPIRHVNPIYPVVLNSFQVFDKEIFESRILNEIKTIELAADQDFISFGFSALCFSQADRLSYAYILEGFDRDWHYVENRRFGSYTDLPPGEYTLRVTYKTPDGDWSNQPLTIKIIRQPHWYQTMWFKILFALCIISAVLLSIQIYTRTRLRKLERELEKQRSIQNMRSRISRDIHDEIGAGLTKISLMSRRFERDENLSDSTKTIASNISSASKNLVQNLGEIVWTINPKNDTLADLIGYIRSYTSSLFENTTIELTLILPEFSEQTSTLLLQPELKRNVILILKESLNNAIKYSGASQILIEVIHKENALTLKIEDDGQGFDPQAFATKGNGLRNMEKRADEINAQFVIESSADNGCKTTLHTALK